MAITTTTILAPPVQQSFSLKLLAVPTPNMIHKIAAVPKRMPKNGGKILRMRRYNPLDTALVPLGNTGITPPGQTPSAVDIDAEISFYGTYVQLNEQVTLQAQDPVLNEMVARLGVSLRQTEDILTRDMLLGTTSIIFCKHGLVADRPTTISDEDIDDVIQSLLGSNAYTVLEGIEATTKYNTSPIRNAFFAMAHTDMAKELENNCGSFTSVSRYPSQEGVLRAEWGSVKNLRFVLSTLGSISLKASAAFEDVYNIPCVGMQAYACIEQDGYSAQFIYRPPIYDGPLALNASVGYKFAEVPRILNDEWVVMLKARKS